MRTFLDQPGRLLAAAAFGALILAAPPSHAQTASQSQRQVATKPAAGTEKSQVEARITDLHTKLHITADQEPKWTDFAQAMRDNAKRMDDALAKRAKDIKTMTAVDDLRSYRDMTEVHHDNLQKLVRAFEPLYDSMSAEQKKTADTVFSQAQTPEKKAARQSKVSKGS